jgi:hypothetical protein
VRKERISGHFPGLAQSGSEITSPFDETYNCIAFAAQDAERRWWRPSEEAYWPSEAPRHVTLAAFEQAFRTLGYARCEDGALESGFQRIAIFADAQGVPTHAARQLDDGTWTSKLGQSEDIRHSTATALEGTVASPTAYGAVALYMKRRSE